MIVKVDDGCQLGRTIEYKKIDETVFPLQGLEVKNIQKTNNMSSSY